MAFKISSLQEGMQARTQKEFIDKLKEGKTYSSLEIENSKLIHLIKEDIDTDTVSIRKYESRRSIFTFLYTNEGKYIFTGEEEKDIGYDEIGY